MQRPPGGKRVPAAAPASSLTRCGRAPTPRRAIGKSLWRNSGCGMKMGCSARAADFGQVGHLFRSSRPAPPVPPQGLPRGFCPKGSGLGRPRRHGRSTGKRNGRPISSATSTCTGAKRRVRPDRRGVVWWRPCHGACLATGSMVHRGAAGPGHSPRAAVIRGCGARGVLRIAGSSPVPPAKGTSSRPSTALITVHIPATHSNGAFRTECVGRR